MRRVEFEPYMFTEVVDIYAIKIDGEANTEFKKFFIMFKDIRGKYLRNDLERIIGSVHSIALNGALESYFRNEGAMSDRVCAIPLLVRMRNKSEIGSLRLYCLRISDNLLIIGGGGLKSSQTYQEDEYLFDKVKTLQLVDKELARLKHIGVDLKEEIINIELEIK